MALPVTLDQLEVFVTVARTGGFAEAARQLARTQSAVSKTIATIERLLDLSLFVRTAQGVTLTAEGGTLLGSAKEVIRSADLFRTEASRVAAVEEGVVSVAFDAFCPAQPVLDALAAMTERFPGTAVVLRTEQLALLPRLVRSGTCALGVCGHQEVRHPQLESRYLRTTSMIPVVGSTHPLAAAMAQSGVVPPSLVAQHVHLYLTERADWLRDDAPEPGDGVTERLWWKLSDLGTKHHCLCDGRGWGMMPQHLVEADLRTGTLVRLHVEGWRETWTHDHYLVRRRGSGAGPAVEFLYAALAQSLQESPNSEK